MNISPNAWQLDQVDIRPNVHLDQVVIRLYDN